MSIDHPKEYLVWVEIEEHDLITDDHVTLDSPGSAVGTFESFEVAYALAADLQAHGGITTKILDLLVAWHRDEATDDAGALIYASRLLDTLRKEGLHITSI